MPTSPSANLSQLTALVKTRLKRMQYRIALLDGFLAGTRLDLTPLGQPRRLKICNARGLRRGDIQRRDAGPGLYRTVRSARPEYGEAAGTESGWLSVTWRPAVYRVRVVIIIVIYLGAFRLAPHDAVPLAASSVLGGLLAAEPTRPRPARRLPASAG